MIKPQKGPPVREPPRSYKDDDRPTLWPLWFESEADRDAYEQWVRILEESRREIVNHIVTVEWDECPWCQGDGEHVPDCPASFLRPLLKGGQD
jgi:hypothetical protein